MVEELLMRASIWKRQRGVSSGADGEEMLAAPDTVAVVGISSVDTGDLHDSTQKTA